MLVPLDPMFRIFGLLLLPPFFFLPTAIITKPTTQVKVQLWAQKGRERGYYVKKKQGGAGQSEKCPQLTRTRVRFSLPRPARRELTGAVRAA